MYSFNKIVIFILVLVAFAVIIFTFIQAVKLPDKPVEITSSYIKSPHTPSENTASQFVNFHQLNILPQEFMSISEQEEVFEGQSDEQNYYSPNITKKIIELINIQDSESIAHINSGYGFLTIHLSKAAGGTGRVFSTESHQAKMLYQLHLRQELSSKNESDREYIDNIILCLSSPESLSLSSQILDKAVLVNTRLYLPDHPHSSYHSSKKVAAHQQEYYNEEDNNERRLLQFFDNAKNFTQSIHKSLKSDGKLIVIENEIVHMELCKKDHILFLEKYGFKMIEDYSGIIEGCLFLIFAKI